MQYKSREIMQKMDEARKRANQKWDRQNMTVIGCKVTKEKAQAFKEACAALGTIPNRVLMDLIDQTIKKAGD